MKTLLLCVTSLFAVGEASADSLFFDVAEETVQTTEDALLACGLSIVDAYSPGLPWPQVPADQAIVNSYKQVLAYTYRDWGWYVYKNPNGGMVHSISASRDHLQLVTPLAGTIAHGNRFMTVGGPDYNLYCKSTPTDYASFLACIKTYFVDVVTGQLCQWATP